MLTAAPSLVRYMQVPLFFYGKCAVERGNLYLMDRRFNYRISFSRWLKSRLIGSEFSFFTIDLQRHGLRYTGTWVSWIFDRFLRRTIPSTLSTTLDGWALHHFP